MKTNFHEFFVFFLSKKWGWDWKWSWNGFLYLSLHVHDDNGVGSVAYNDVIRIFRQQMHRIDIDTSAGWSSNRFESVQTFGCLAIPDFDSAIWTGRN